MARDLAMYNMLTDFFMVLFILTNIFSFIINIKRIKNIRIKEFIKKHGFSTNITLASLLFALNLFQIRYEVALGHKEFFISGCLCIVFVIYIAYMAYWKGYHVSATKDSAEK